MAGGLDITTVTEAAYRADAEGRSVDVREPIEGARIRLQYAGVE